MRVEKKVNLDSYMKLEKCLIKWQSIFNLDDWEIHIRSDNDIGAKSWISIQGVNKQAEIKIITYDEYMSRDFNSFNWDMEESIVHELVHLLFVDLEKAIGFKKMEEIDFHMERQVEVLARKFIELERSRYVLSGKAED